jgi:hypothetical protein
LRRGEIRWYTFRVPDKRRPVLLLTRSEILGQLNEVIVVPATCTIRGLTSEVSVNAERYTAGDMFGRENLWATLPAIRWDKVKVGVEISVRYLPDRPRISELVDLRSSRSDNVACLILGAACMIVAALCWRKRATASTDP